MSGAAELGQLGSVVTVNSTTGNVGIGVVPSAWSVLTGIDLNDRSGLHGYTNQTTLSYNCYYNGTNWIYKATDFASAYGQQQGEHIFYGAASGTSGGTIGTSLTARLKIDTNGNILNVSTGGLGYGTGSGGTVTQLTSKSTGVTLNKSCGQITMNAAALASGALVSFVLTNSLIASTDTMLIHVNAGVTNSENYTVRVRGFTAGAVAITLKNESGGSLSEAVVLSFSLIKAVTA